MPVVVHHQDASFLALDLEPPIGILKAGQSLGNLLESNVQLQPHGHGGNGIQDTVMAGDLQPDDAERLSMLAQRIGRAKILEFDVRSHQIGLIACSIGHNAALNARNDRLDVWILKAEHRGAVKRHFVRKGHKCGLDLGQVRVMIEVFSVDGCNHCDGRGQLEKGPVALIRFGDDEIPLSKPGVGSKCVESSADHDCRIIPAVAQDRRDHGGGRGFAVAPGDRDSVLQAHQLGKHLRPGYDRYLPPLGFEDFHVVGSDGG